MIAKKKLKKVPTNLLIDMNKVEEQPVLLLTKFQAKPRIPFVSPKQRHLSKRSTSAMIAVPQHQFNTVRRDDITSRSSMRQQAAISPKSTNRLFSPYSPDRGKKTERKPMKAKKKAKKSKKKIISSAIASDEGGN